MSSILLLFVNVVTFLDGLLIFNKNFTASLIGFLYQCTQITYPIFFCLKCALEIMLSLTNLIKYSSAKSSETSPRLIPSSEVNYSIANIISCFY
jgi:hypothetical protein